MHCPCGRSLDPIAFLLLVVRPGAPSSFLLLLVRHLLLEAMHLLLVAFLLLVVRPGAPSSFLFLRFGESVQSYFCTLRGRGQGDAPVRDVTGGFCWHTKDEATGDCPKCMVLLARTRQSLRICFLAGMGESASILFLKL